MPATITPTTKPYQKSFTWVESVDAISLSTISPTAHSMARADPPQLRTGISHLGMVSSIEDRLRQRIVVPVDRARLHPRGSRRQHRALSRFCGAAS